MFLSTEVYHRPVYELLADPRMTAAHLAELRAEYRLREQDRKRMEKKHTPAAGHSVAKGRTSSRR